MYGWKLLCSGFDEFQNGYQAVDSLTTSGMLEDLKSSTASIRSLFLLLQMNSESIYAPGWQDAICEDVVKAAVGDGARCVLCGAVLLCIGDACGSDVLSQVLDLMIQTEGFWDATADLLEAAMATHLTVLGENFSEFHSNLNSPHVSFFLRF